MPWRGAAGESRVFMKEGRGVVISCGMVGEYRGFCLIVEVDGVFLAGIGVGL